LLCSNDVKFVQREIREILSYLVDQNKTKLPASQTVTTKQISPKIYQGQPPTMYWRVLQISSNSVHYWWTYSQTCEHRQIAP